MRKLKHAEIKRVPISEISAQNRHRVVVVLDNLRSLHNVGSIFRTSDAFWLEKIYLCGISATPEHPEVHKTALGAQDTMPWEYIADTKEVIKALKTDGYTIAALEITDSPRHFDTLMAHDFPLCLIVGHEVFGVADEVIELCDFALEIPQFGVKQSLNVSVAFGVAAFAVVEQFRKIPI